MTVHFADIDLIVNHHCLNFLFIIIFFILAIHCLCKLLHSNLYQEVNLGQIKVVF